MPSDNDILFIDLGKQYDNNANMGPYYNGGILGYSKLYAQVDSQPQVLLSY